MADLKITGYQLDLQRDCVVGIIPMSAPLNVNNARHRAVLKSIDGWLAHRGDHARCIGCNKRFNKMKLGGYAVLIPQPLIDEDSGISAGICCDCITRPQDDLRNAFARALKKDRIATARPKEG